MNARDLIKTSAMLVGLVGSASAAEPGMIADQPGSMVPECLASPSLLLEHDVARTVLGAMPQDQRDELIRAGAFGTEGLAVHGEHHDTRPLEELLDPANLAEFDADQRAMAESLGQMIRDGQRIALPCFAEGVNPKFVELIDALYEASIDTGGSRYQGIARWGITATDGGGLTLGDPITITYSFVPDGTFIPNSGLGSGSSVLFSFMNGIYGNTATWQNLFAQAFNRWAELIGVTYVYEPNDDGVQLNGAAGSLGVRGDVRIGCFNLANDSTNGGVLAYNMFPNDGDMVLDTDNFFNGTANNSRRLRNVVGHEHGHGLGMLHVCPLNQTKLMEPFASTQFDGPQLDEILGGQRRYGDHYEPQSDELANPPLIGSLNAGQSIVLQNVSIDDDSDVDIYRIDVPSALTLQVVAVPDADEYSQGTETQSCTNGILTDYNSILDLEVYVTGSQPPYTLYGYGNTGAIGESESFAVGLPGAGSYLIQVYGLGNNGIQRYLLGLNAVALGPCSNADVAAPFGTLNFFDIQTYIGLYNAHNPSADLAAPIGTFNFFDIQAYIALYNQGCP